MTDRALIVGAGQAAVQLAVSLREQGWTAPITLVGAESHAPYQRPPLSKSYLTGEAGAHTLRLRNSEFYREHGIEVVLGERVTGVDRERGMARTDRGRSLPWTALALATGARVRRLSVPGADLPGVHHLRDRDDADALARALPTARQVVVVGGGFLGLEVAAAARTFGASVCVVEATSRLVARAVAPDFSDFLARAHRRRGVDVILGCGVAALESAADAVCAVHLDDGRRLPADVVVVGIGVLPRTELAEQAGLAVAGGIVVDACARTSDPRVVAAGDCTVLTHPAAVGPIRLESVQNAQDQARVAAATLVGRPLPYTAVPWFWSDQGDLKLQIAGLSRGHDEVVLRGAVEEERFAALYYREGRLIAAECINRAPDYLAVRRALNAGATVPMERAADTSVPLKELVATHPAELAR